MRQRGGEGARVRHPVVQRLGQVPQHCVLVVDPPLERAAIATETLRNAQSCRRIKFLARRKNTEKGKKKEKKAVADSLLQKGADLPSEFVVDLRR